MTVDAFDEQLRPCIERLEDWYNILVRKTRDRSIMESAFVREMNEYYKFRKNKKTQTEAIDRIENAAYIMGLNIAMDKNESLRRKNRSLRRIIWILIAAIVIFASCSSFTRTSETQSNFNFSNETTEGIL